MGVQISIDGDGQVHLPGLVNLSCSASGIPEPEYVWVRCEGTCTANCGGEGCNLVPVELVSGRVTSDGGNLTFASTQREDDGRYKCVAINDAGNATSSSAVEIMILGGCGLTQPIAPP